jgi:L-seryl-tRNA(Ser) seleniumtransferase
VVPRGGHGHSSINHAARLMGCRIVEAHPDDLSEILSSIEVPDAAIITAVTSSLEELSDSEIRRATTTLRSVGCRTMLDDAYGARIRPILRNGAPSLELGADVAVTNGDKAALAGPRCCMVAGDPRLVREIESWASSSGLDARVPSLMGLLRALQAFSPDALRTDVADGELLNSSLNARFGDDVVVPGLLGPTIWEEDAHSLVLSRAQGQNPGAIRPCETTAAIAMILLSRYGIVTVNAMSHPGSRVALRLKPTTGSIANVGGAAAFTAALDDAIATTAEHFSDASTMAAVILGPTTGKGL